jgi:hypothetical protein
MDGALRSQWAYQFLHEPERNQEGVGGITIIPPSEKPADLNYCHEQSLWCNFSKDGSCIYPREGERRCSFEVSR